VTTSRIGGSLPHPLGKLIFYGFGNDLLVFPISLVDVVFPFDDAVDK
jgi:hypothetical protein